MHTHRACFSGADTRVVHARGLLAEGRVCQVMCTPHARTSAMLTGVVPRNLGHLAGTFSHSQLVSMTLAAGGERNMHRETRNETPEALKPRPAVRDTSTSR